MAQIIGIQRKVYDFADKTGNHVHSEGYNLFVAYPAKGVDGVKAEAIYISDNKLCGYTPHLGDEIKVSYNRWGKVDEVRLA